MSTIPAALAAPEAMPQASTSAEPSGAPGARARTLAELLAHGSQIKLDESGMGLTTAALAFIDELAAALAKEPEARLEVISHSADSGDAKKDLAVSKRRAETVRSALIARGITPGRVMATGRGSQDPIVPNLTRTGRMRNERFELHRAAATKKP